MEMKSRLALPAKAQLGDSSAGDFSRSPIGGCCRAREWFAPLVPDVERTLGLVVWLTPTHVNRERPAGKIQVKPAPGSNPLGVESDGSTSGIDAGRRRTPCCGFPGDLVGSYQRD